MPVRTYTLNIVKMMNFAAGKFSFRTGQRQEIDALQHVAADVIANLQQLFPVRNENHQNIIVSRKNNIIAPKSDLILARLERL